MNTNFSKQAKDILLSRHIDIYIVAFLNAFLILGILIGRETFFHGFFISISLAINIAALATIIIKRFSPKKSKRAVLRKNKYVAISALCEMFILFGLSLRPLPLPYFLVFQTLAVIAAQSCAMFFFWKAFRKELAPLFAFLVRGGAMLYQDAVPRLSRQALRISKIKVPIFAKIKLTNKNVL